MADKESNPATVETLFNRKAFNHVQILSDSPFPLSVKK